MFAALLSILERETYIVIEQEQALLRFLVRLDELILLQERRAVCCMFSANLRKEHTDEHSCPRVTRVRSHRLV